MLGGPLIYMMQTTKNRPRNDIRSILNLHLSRRCKGSNLSDGTMRTPSIEVANILIQDPAQMAFGHCHVNRIRSEIEVTRRLSKCSFSMA